MKKVISTVAILMLVSAFVFGQTLNEKKKQLQELRDEISKQEKIIEDAEKSESDAKDELKNSQKKVADLEKKIKKLEKSEKNAKQKLNLTKEQLENKKGDIVDAKITHSSLNDLFNKEIEMLFNLHYKSLIHKKSSADKEIVAALLDRTVQNILTTDVEISELTGQKNKLESQKNKNKKEFENYQWSKIVNKKKKTKVSDDITEVKEDIASLEMTKEQALNMKNQLETEAKSLNDLISKLQLDIIADDFSYSFDSKLSWPVKGEILRDFGELKSDTYNVTLQNNGIDISAEPGTEVRSVESGVVVFSEWYSGAGKLVIINHKNGFYSLYSHNSSLLVSKGDEIIGNQIIALSGNTGSTEEACLHFELRKGGTPVNPLEYLK
jgi:septal ring factor EnvC (AmiA/AmiB activator)